MKNIFESYDYKYNGLNRKEIEEKLYAEIMDVLYKRYGASPDPQILKRVQEEWMLPLCMSLSLGCAKKSILGNIWIVLALFFIF